MERFEISFPEFRLGDIIDPDEANTNNADISFKLNEIIDALNSLWNDGEGGTSIINIRGNVIDIKKIEGFESESVEDFLNELVTKLASTEEGASGASIIGVAPSHDMQGSTVEERFRSLHDHVESGLQGIMNEVGEDGGIVVTRLRVLKENPRNPSVGEIWMIDDN